MFVVSYSTFSWSSLRVIKKIPVTDAVVVVLTSVITVWKDLAVAVVAGTILSALSFAWQQSQRVAVTSYTSDTRYAEALPRGDGELGADSKTYHINGYIFFGSSSNFQRAFDPTNDPRHVVMDFMEARVLDYTGMQAINQVCSRYGSQDKTVIIKHLSAECASMLRALNGKNAPYQAVVEDPSTDPKYDVAASRPTPKK
mmetsp:Transcript_100661/g.288439  ORF Transcript_100661/g.288439 Transcript_100661/m.288439 type:complete len:199 (+) Transcript_100661:120-716(+)